MQLNKETAQALNRLDNQAWEALAVLLEAQQESLVKTLVAAQSEQAVFHNQGKLALVLQLKDLKQNVQDYSQAAAEALHNEIPLDENLI